MASVMDKGGNKMKKLLLIVLILGLFTSHGCAQMSTGQGGGMMGGWGWGMNSGWFFIIIIAILVILFVVFMMKRR